MSYSSDGTLLIVQHGQGRGRLYNFRRHVLEWLGAEAPGLRARIRLHETGGPDPLLDDVRAVVFWLADPLRELYPQDYLEAVAIADAVRVRGGAVVNPPEALSNSIKSTQSRLWREAGIPCAECIPVPDHGELAGAVARTGLPAIVRSDLHHAQENTHFCQGEADVAAVPRDGRLYPATAIPFIDVRAGYRHERPGTVWAELWHKKRSFVFGGIVVPTHVLFSADPIVGLKRATFHRYRNSWELLTPLVAFRRWDREALRVDRAYGEGAPEQPDLLVRAVRALGLEYAAVDYCTRVDGSLVLWEANPYFTMPVGARGHMAWARRLRARNRRIYVGMARYFETLLQPRVRDPGHRAGVQLPASFPVTT